MQKHSADVEAGKPLCRRWRFWLGLLVNLGSEAGLTTVALALAPLSFIAPLAGLAVVFNALIAHFGCVPGVRERMGRIEWLATGFIMGGVTLVAISGPGGGDSSEADALRVVVADLPAAFSQPIFIAYAACSALVVGSWLVLTEQRCLPQLRERWRPRDDSIAASVGSSFTAALTSGFSIIFLKVVALGVAEWISGGAPPADTVVYACLGCLCCSAPLQLYLLNLTLASGRATFTIPIYLSLTMILTSASGGILFGEFAAVAHREPAPLWLLVYAVAVLIVIGGLVVLSSRQEAKTQIRQTSREASRVASRQASRSDLALVEAGFSIASGAVVDEGVACAASLVAQAQNSERPLNVRMSSNGGMKLAEAPRAQRTPPSRAARSPQPKSPPKDDGHCGAAGSGSTPGSSPTSSGTTANTPPAFGCWCAARSSPTQNC